MNMQNMHHTLSNWIDGYTISLIFGTIFTFIFWSSFRKYKCEPMLKDLRNWEIKRLQPKPNFGIIQGIVERVFFTIFVAFYIPGAGIAMIAWVALKMAAGWNKAKSKAAPCYITSSLLTNLISMIFASIGGLVCNGFIPLNIIGDYIIFNYTDLILSSSLFPILFVIQVLWLLTVSGLCIFKKQKIIFLYNFVSITISSLILIFLYFTHFMNTVIYEESDIKSDLIIKFLIHWQNYITYEFVIGVISSILSFILILKISKGIIEKNANKSLKPTGSAVDSNPKSELPTGGQGPAA